MDVEIKMPDLATTDDTVILVRWLAQVGQAVKLGQPLFEVETDKATMEVESIAEGVLTAVRAEPGSLLPVGQVIAVIASGERVNAPPAVIEKPLENPHPPAPSPSGRRGAKPLAASLMESGWGEGFEPPPMAARQSLFARNRAARSALRESPRAPAVAPDSISLTPAQRTTARRMQQSKQTAPHFYLTLSANAEGMATARAAAPELVWDAFFVRAVARAAADFERMRRRFEEDRLTPIPGGAVGVAADVDDNLYVIPIDNPLALSLSQVSGQITRQVERIRQGNAASLTARKLGVTYLTISNLGGAGIEAFAPIINPPEPAILGIGRIAPAAHVQDGGIIIQRRVTLTLAVDHRVASGKYAAAFLQRIVSELEAVR